MDDPNRSAWMLADSLGLNRVVLYSCVAAFGRPRLRGVDAAAAGLRNLTPHEYNQWRGPWLENAWEQLELGY